MKARDKLLELAAKNPNLVWVRANGMEDTPEYAVQVDYEKAMVMGLSPGDINSTLGIAWGTSYVNNFIHRGKFKKVYLQADAPFACRPKISRAGMCATDTEIWCHCLLFRLRTGHMGRRVWNGLMGFLLCRFRGTRSRKVQRSGHAGHHRYCKLPARWVRL